MDPISILAGINGVSALISKIIDQQMTYFKALSPADQAIEAKLVMQMNVNSMNFILSFQNSLNDLVSALKVSK